MATKVQQVVKYARQAIVEANSNSIKTRSSFYQVKLQRIITVITVAM